MKTYKDILEYIRDYKAEYKKFQSSPERIKYRAELVKYNRDKGTYGNGDKKDASHKGGKIVGFEDQSKNRGRAEASRLKKNELHMLLPHPPPITSTKPKKADKKPKIPKAVGEVKSSPKRSTGMKSPKATKGPERGNPKAAGWNAFKSSIKG